MLKGNFQINAGTDIVSEYDSNLGEVNPVYFPSNNDF